MKNSTKEAALLVTKYERFGAVGRSELIEYWIDEEITIIPELVDDYNEYLTEYKGEEPIYHMDDLSDLLAGMDPVEAFNLALFTPISKFSVIDEYYTFDVYGQLESLSGYRLLKVMQEDRDFLRWYAVKLLDDEDEDEINGVIMEANKLIKQGY